MPLTIEEQDKALAREFAADPKQMPVLATIGEMIELAFIAGRKSERESARAAVVKPCWHAVIDAPCDGSCQQ